MVEVGAYSQRWAIDDSGVTGAIYRAGTPAQDGIQRTRTQQARAERNRTDQPSPFRGAFEEKEQAQQPQPDSDTQSLFQTTDVAFHDVPPVERLEREAILDPEGRWVCDFCQLRGKG